MKNIRKILRPAAALLLSLAAAGAMAGSQSVAVSIVGPGGHSNGDYGNVNAVHAAARTVLPPMWPAQRLKVHFITLLFRLRGLEVRFIALDVCYNKTIAKQKGRGSHDSTIPVCSRPH